ncbi:cytochrome c peroxidase [Candidatus Parabeggiatoa sp. HSG14]|uniref:cytochrome-c peroxidase n=1 Tax=Candidatus Parabeggiatoa sp. HSG14 TaxID=3055593 RepID=UPI0025A795F7|nr:cytochrome c peroxidase [Thiotrichales bacterium HSG14]
MRKRIKQHRLLTISMSLAVALTANLDVMAETPDIGPLPPLKINQAKAELGKRLFFDTRLSGDSAISCASCHDPKYGFSTNKALSDGYPGNKHFRNAPTLINTSHKKVWMHDGRIGTNLNDVTRGMITEDYIMNMDMRIMQERLKQDAVYLDMFEKAGYGEPSNGKVRKAIPEYLKTLTSRGAPFDTGTMSESAKRGMALFTGKANCTACHNGPLFSDGSSHNTGVPENFDIFRDPFRHQAFIAYNMFMGNENYMNLKRDPGTHVQTHKADGSDMGKFMTPTLRELKYTAPYMHNGMLQTLEDVVEFYNNGGGTDSNKDTLLKPLHLIDSEKQELVAFLLALSGELLTTEKHVWTDAYPNEYEPIEDWRNVRN